MRPRLLLALVLLPSLQSAQHPAGGDCAAPAQPPDGVEEASPDGTGDIESAMRRLLQAGVGDSIAVPALEEATDASATPHKQQPPPPPTPVAAPASCPEGYAMIPRDHRSHCEVLSPESVTIKPRYAGRGKRGHIATYAASKMVVAVPENIPMYFKTISPKLVKRIKQYILENEDRLLAFPVGQGRWDDDDPTLTARSSSYNLLLSGEENNTRHISVLSDLRTILADAVLEYLMQDKFVNRIGMSSGSEDTPWRRALNKAPWVWQDVPAVFVHAWASVHRHHPKSSTEGEQWPQYSYLRPHAHMHPLTGYLTIEGAGSDTLFRSPYFDQRLFSVKGHNGKIVIFPGGVRHQTTPWLETDSTKPRISVGFNIEFAHPLFWHQHQQAAGGWGGDDLTVESLKRWYMMISDAQMPAVPEGEQRTTHISWEKDKLFRYYWQMRQIMSIYNDTGTTDSQWLSGFDL